MNDDSMKSVSMKSNSIKSGSMKSAAGIVFNIQRCSLDDGPGVRTAVFLKGCHLRCLWCHNPEGQSPAPETMDGATVGALMTADEVMSVVLRDIGHYRAAGGGLTLTGGEPLCQPAFASELLKRAKAEGIHTCVETCGVPFEAVDALLPHADLWLCDIKAGASLHARLTGVELEAALRGIRRISAGGGKIILRCPLIPGVNDTPDRISQIEELKKLDGVLGAQTMPYHEIGLHKYASLGRVCELGSKNGNPT